MGGYIYRGSDFDAVPKRGPHAGKLPFDPAHCGTTRGVTQHRRLKQKNCLKCADHYNTDRRARRDAKKVGK